MKKHVYLLLPALFLAVNLQSQSLNQVLDAHFEAVNQKKTLEVKTVTMNGRIMQMGMELPMVMKMKRPDKVRMELNIQGQEMVTAYDGVNGWMIAPWIGPDPQDMPADQLKDMKERADFEGDLWNYEEKGHKAEFQGKADMEGTDAWVIRLTKKNGDVATFYIDTDSYLLIKQKTRTVINGVEVESEQIPGNYKLYSGIPMPTSIESRAMGQSVQIIFDNIEFDVLLDDGIFARPVK